MKSPLVEVIDSYSRGTASPRLSDFVRDAWHVVEPTANYIDNWHIGAICDHLTAVTNGQIRNLVINMPPRHMKSLLVSVFWPCWEWTYQPSRRWLYASYAQSLATRDSLKCRRLIRSRWYQKNFGSAFVLTGDQNQKMRFENDKTGYRLATSVGGLGTGEGGDRIVVDDPHNVLEAESARVRSTVLSWWDETMASRGNDPKTVARVIVMQRVHHDDLTGHVLAQGGYEHLCLPAEYESSEHQTSIGWRDPRGKTGELLHPSRFGPSELSELKLRLGSRAAAGQLQQRPTPSEGAIFKAAWFESRYKTLPPMNRVASFWDTAIKTGEENDETAYVTVGVSENGNLYILNAGHGRWETPSVASLLCERSDWIKEHFGAAYVGDYIEDKVSGSTLIQYIRRSHPGMAIIPIKTDLDKIARAHAVTPICESGTVLFPDPSIFINSATWQNDLITNLLTFPAAKHDDLTDSFVYALKWFITTRQRKTSRYGFGSQV